MRKIPSSRSVACTAQKYVGSAFDAVQVVVDNIDNINTVRDNLPAIEEALKEMPAIKEAPIAAEKAKDWADKSEDEADRAQAIADALGIAPSGDYKGLWPDLGGSAEEGDTWQTQASGKPTGRYFAALQNTTVDPISDNVNWREVVSNQSLGGLTNYTVSTVADLKSGSWLAGNIVNTKSYHSSMLTGSNPPVGGGSYIIKTPAQYGGVPDGNVDHYVGGGTSLIAQLIRRGTTIEAEQCGIIPNSQSDALFNLTTINEVIDNVIGSGGVIEAIYKQYFFEGALILKNGVSLLGMDGVTYRDNHDGQTRLTFTTDTDGVSLDGFSVFRNALKNIKIDNTLAVGTSISKGLNYSANGGGTGTRGLGGIIDNLTIQNFKYGSVLGSEGDFNWNQEIKNLKIYRCQKSLVIDGSNGVSQIDGLHIDPAGGFSSGLVGVGFLNGNGFTISNYGIENNNIGLSFEGNENNDRLYLNDGYMEGNLTTDFDFIENCSGQIYSNKLRCAYFSSGVKPACFSAASNASVSGTFTDTTIRGDQSGSDGLSRVTSFVSSVTEIGFDGLNLQADCEIWQDFGSGKSPTFVRMINRDKAGNSFSLYRDVLSPTRMFAKTERVSSVAPVASDTFTVSMPSGSDLDLKYIGATVRGLSPGVWNEWIWDGTSFIATP